MSRRDLGVRADYVSRAFRNTDGGALAFAASGNAPGNFKRSMGHAAKRLSRARWRAYFAGREANAAALDAIAATRPLKPPGRK